MIDLARQVADLSPAQRELLAKRLAQNPQAAEPIAIVGMGCRFAGANDLEQFWQIIRDGVDATSEIPASRWNADEFYDEDFDAPGKMATRWGGFVDGVDEFDPQFFGITPREAQGIDPQQRLLLEVAWETLEHAGLSPERMRGSATGVFIGIGATDYAKVAAQSDDYINLIDAHVGTGNALSIAANRISYLFDFHGPSLAVDTACSSALVGVHSAVQALRNWECDHALAGGVNLILSPEVTIAFSKARMLSADGKCRPFDANANGYVRGEGCGMLLLKRLTDAIRDGDQVLSVIRGTAVNQDGRTSGITAPNSLYQQAVIRTALAEAGLTPDDVGYIEAHGTATPLGDPIELQSLGQIFKQNSADDKTCFFSSVKANIGHTETVSGVAGIIKAVLMLQHHVLPPQVHLSRMNEHISLAGTRLKVVTEATSWPSDVPAVAGISSFGFGGTNAHVVIQGVGKHESIDDEVPSRRHLGQDNGQDNGKSDRPLHLLPLSARSESALTHLAERYHRFLSGNPQHTIADACHTAAVGRSHFGYRATLTASSAEQLLEQLANLSSSKSIAGVKQRQVKSVSRLPIAFLCTGQGSQFVGMGRELFEAHPVFRRSMLQCDEILQPHLDASLLSVIYATDDDPRINETQFSQPALFALEYSLATLWRSCGVTPDLVMGHSVGEYTAACIAGVMSLEDSLWLISQRGNLMSKLPHDGSMAVIFADSKRVESAASAYSEFVSVAAANGPENTVVSGKSCAVAKIVESMEAIGVKSTMLEVSHAFHSPLMEPMLDEFERMAGEIQYSSPRIPIVSNLTGTLAGESAYNARYWRDHVRGTVRFEDAVNQLAEQNIDVVLELGPTPALLGMARRCLPQLETNWVPTLRKGQCDWKCFLEAMSQLYLSGAELNWQGFDREWPRRRISLPTYPFERSRHWLKTSNGSTAARVSRGPSLHPLLGNRIESALTTAQFEAHLSCASPSYLADHVVQGSAILPAAAYIEQGLAAAQQVFGPGNHRIENLSIQQAMFLSNESSRRVQTIVAPEMNGQCTFEIYSVADNASAGEAAPRQNWAMHAWGQLCRESDDQATQPVESLQLHDKSGSVIATDDFYRMMSDRGLHYGPAFQVLDQVHRQGSTMVARVAVTDAIRTKSDQYHLHPTLLDGCLQAMAGVVSGDRDSLSEYTYLPTGMGSLQTFGKWHEQLQGEVYVVAKRVGPSDGSSIDNDPNPEVVEASIALVNSGGNVIVQLSGVTVQRLGRPGEAKTTPKDWLYQVQWQPQRLSSDDATAKQSLEGNWILLADRAGFAASLATRMRKDGARCIMVEIADDFQCPEDTSTADLYRINPLVGEHYKRLLSHSLSDDQLACRAVVQLWSSDDATRDPAVICSETLQLIQQLAKFTGPRPPQLYTLTRSAQLIGKEPADVSPAQSAIWGIVRVAMNEHPELACRLIDLDSSNDELEALVIDELASESDESQVAFRNGERLVARLAAASKLIAAGSSSVTVPQSDSYRLRLGEAGSIDGLRFESFTRVPLEADQVEIRVGAAGLNFSDVLKAMGLYPGLKDKVVPLGIECAGVVSAVGEKVSRFKVGDAVMGVAPHSFATHARTAEFALVHKPDSMDDVEAATVPITFLTAYYALCRLAHLSRGEKVLIHAGAGGVGLAAIQIAKHVGAEVYATAGSDEKREFLRSLGVKHVSNSRTLEFGQEILSLTDRQGVDVVLNSLPGDAITESLRVLASYGRFLEIGKTDIYQNRMIGLSPFQDNLSYHAIDLDRMLRQRPELMQEMFQELTQHFADGSFQPIASTVFPIEDVVGSFRYMAQRRNIGKVVVSLARQGSAQNDAETIDHPSCGTRLITGGLGALGLQVADWVARSDEQPHVALLSRRAPTAEVCKRIERLRADGARVAVLQGDVTDANSLREAISMIPADFPQVSGVIHAAGVLDDGWLLDLDQNRLSKVMAPKTQGAWNLHEATVDLPLDYFVMFSSIASLLGSPGQANYAAGNAFLDGLAAYRRSRNLPALAINWGPWAESGMAADESVKKQLAERGMTLLPADDCFALLDGLLQATKIGDSTATHAAIIDVRWRTMMKQIKSGVPPLLRDVVPTDDDAAASNPADDAFRSELRAMDRDARESRLQEFLTGELASIMGLGAAELDVHRPLSEMGLDSLMAIELKNNMESRLAITVPMARFMDGPSVATLCEVAAELVTGEASSTSERETVAGANSAISGDGSAFSRPLTHGQQALWFIQQMAPESSAYHVSDAMRVIGDFNLDHVRSALQTLVNRHSAYRTTFHHNDGHPYQAVHPTTDAPLEIVDATGWSEDETQQHAVTSANEPFDLERGPLIRLIIYRQAVDRHLLVWVVHHIVADLLSLVTSTVELKQLYAAALIGESLELPAPGIEFADFANDEREMLSGHEGAEHLQYWQEQLSGELPMLELATDRPRPAIQTFDGALLYHSLSQELTSEIQAFGQRHQATLNMVLLAAYELLMAKYSGQDDILVGMPASGRTRSDVAGVVGYFVNPVVVRGDLSANPTVADFVKQIRGKMIGALEHQSYPFPLLVEKLAPQRDASRSPIFQSMFAMWRFHKASQQGFAPFMAGQRDVTLEAFGIDFEPAGLEQKNAMFDLSLTASDADESGVTLALQYNVDLFNESTAREMLSHYEQILLAMVQNDELPVGELSMLSQDQQQTLLQWGNGPVSGSASESTNPCLHRLIERQVAIDPDAIAVVAADATLTYGELNGQANQLAHHLRSLGTELESPVGICLPRGSQMIVAMLAILKAGGTYVPLDQDLPSQRKHLITDDAQIRHVIVAKGSDQWSHFAGHFIDLSADALAIAECDSHNPEVLATPSTRAYLIYTSGSTGKPKAVEIEHHSVVNYVQFATKQFGLLPSDRVLQFASISFDHSVEEIFPTLASGAALVIRDESISLLADSFLQSCQQHGVTVLDLPTAFWRQLTHEALAGDLEIPALVRLLVTGGERATADQVAAWRRLTGDQVRFINNYGPTETTIVATAWEATGAIDGDQEIPIGRPVAGVTARVLDRHGRLAAKGVAGELHVGGMGVARGYLNQPKLTRDRFIDSKLGDGDRLYRTGDLARWRDDGNLEFLGRVDQQVKVRGFRVELGEIEAALLTLEAVKDAIVLASDDASGMSRLTAFVVPVGGEMSGLELGRSLSQTLPEYMIPTAWVMLSEFPRNKSDKVDRKALQALSRSSSSRESGFVAPRSAIEMQMAGIWIDVLKVDVVGVRDNFFDLGGHSLLAVQLISRVNRHFNVSLQLSSLLRDATVERMAVLVTQSDLEKAWSPLVPIRPEGTLSPVFCVHPAGGNVLCYYELAHALEDERPIFALQSRGVDGLSNPHDTMEAMVNEYIDAIRGQQPIGPYHLAGWSSGGVVAYEIARVLHEQGDRVDGVHLIDSRVMSAIDLIDPEDESRILTTLAETLQRFYGLRIDVDYDELQMLDSQQRLELMIQRGSIAGQSLLEFDIDYLRNFVQVARSNLRAMRDYVPPKSDVSVKLYRAAERLGELDEDLSDDLGWQSIVGNQLVVTESPGDHISMMTGENVAKLGKLMSDGLSIDPTQTSSVSDTSEPELRPFYEDVQAHYDRSNAFYQLFLDRTMTYSCGYFPSDEATLEEAQLAKIDLSLGKCRLKPGMHLLDVGCGWGATALRAVDTLGVKATGLTLSKNQHAYASSLANGRGDAEFLLKGWEEFDKPVDRIVSIGALEHFRMERYAAFFGRCRELLPDDGWMMIHSIIRGNKESLQPGQSNVDEGLIEYAKMLGTEIFPGGQLPPREVVIHRAEAEGFSLHHTESLRPHYARTLDKWAESLQAHREEAIELTSLANYDLYVRYLTSSAHYFRTGHLDLIQFTFRVK
ncbi:MAG: amino acid adenylation domain-containing protein [Pirellulaceae bacterium]